MTISQQNPESDAGQLPVIPVETFLSVGSDPEACRMVAEELCRTGILIIRDPRVSEAANEEFLDLMEAYFNQPDEVKKPDERPNLDYQLGVTPADTEVPRDHCERILLLPAEHAAHKPTGADAKWRYFWRIGERPTKTAFPELNAAPVIPAAFPQWSTVMNQWGTTMLATVRTVCTMAARGFGLADDALASLLDQGPHLLAPTGSDLSKHNQLGQIFAGYHYDLNLLTIHGKSRYAGLFVWLRDGTKMPVRVPRGCLILQAGKQFEWLTGGRVLCGFHEVVVTEGTHAGMDEARRLGRPLWRVSSTLFSHVRSDALLEVLPEFRATDAAALKDQQKRWPSIPAGQQVSEELYSINLKRS